ncbi:phenoloxidase-activating factor 2-like [Drosophila innubila]|uniref:phenoloxidase-activating factor 2-like n=1 Tax=Drosophila innubila TaxID=198719 RepID=UPI00148B8E2E|nr:phenoloxidase-activating factor 2-like [Drosophila innubila]
MWIIWSLPAALVLLTSCISALPQVTDNFDGSDVNILENAVSQTDPRSKSFESDLPQVSKNFNGSDIVSLLEEIMSPKDSYDDRSKAFKSDLPQNFVAELNNLRRNITAALSAINQQGEILKGLIDGMLKQIEPAETITPSTTTSKPETNIVTKSCGIDKVCVKKGQCESDDKDINGNYKIQFRSAQNDNPCHYLETCCHIDDRIEESTSPDGDDDDDEIPECGQQHSRGKGMTLAATPNKEAEFGEYPWMVAIMLASDEEPEYIGGGSILAPNVVLTSAHKVQKCNPDELVIRAGDWDLKTNLEIYPHVDRSVKQMILHDRFSRDSRQYNIALLVLTMSFSSNPHIAPICLPSSSDSFHYSDCIVTGWGKRSQNSSDYPHILKEITVPFLPRKTCNDQLRKPLGSNFVLDETSVCAGGERGVDSCLGDGGSPLVCPIKGHPNRYYQVGIVAWGLGCGKENVPAVYTNVPYLYPWIIQELKKLNVDSRYYTLNNVPKIIRSF